MTSSCAHEEKECGQHIPYRINLLISIYDDELTREPKRPEAHKNLLCDWLIYLEHRFIMLSMSSVLNKYNFHISILYKHVRTSLNYMLLILGSISRHISFTIAEGVYHSETTDVFMRWIAIHRTNSACKGSWKVRAEWCGNGYVERVFHC